MTNQSTPGVNIDPQERIERAQQAQVPRIYFNGFQAALTNSDVVLVVECNGVPAGQINMSYTTAKTLGKALETIISQLETKVGREMLTTHDFDAKMRESENDL